MFDMGFLELLMIGVIALLVFGPDKLPGIARSAGLWIGRIKRQIGSIKDDIDKELRLQELQEQMQQSDLKNSVYDFVNETRNTLNQKIGDADDDDTFAPTSHAETAQKTDKPAAQPTAQEAAKPSYSAVSSAPPRPSTPPSATEDPASSAPRPNADAAAAKLDPAAPDTTQR